MSKYLEPGNQTPNPKGGRPLGTFKFSVPEMQTKVQEWMDSYGEKGKREGKVPLLQALKFELDLTDDGFSNYQHRDDYRPMLARAKLFCEIETAHKLFDPRIRPAGAIFTLKANHGWKDGSENKPVQVNFTWNNLQLEAEKARKQLEAPDDVREVTDID